ncbi:Peptide methionine sulfoxide reductase MsrA [Planctomycetes bacterium LzC2]|uniref:Peptide methionine sulfoxide reductase MsrA n=2 Tax=Alienimonas chondri TaxID=2681879 RepID=A0ABX1VFA4_9PLAN|nr:Peptide methionine sulfoxide reductase MsrA [Alienimonas chondri]
MTEPTTETATFAAGCFWGIEDAFRKTPGVIDAVSGYIGGRLDNPTYEDVCYRDTGHAEAVEVTFDPNEVSFEQLLKQFRELHDPTQVDRQGPDVGSQYRSAIFTHSPEQQAAAEQWKQALNDSGTLPRPVATQIAPATTFYRAEEYHQRYFEKTGRSACHI